MECPRCGKDEFSSDGTCLACNHKIEPQENAAEPEAVKDENGSSGLNSGDNPADGTPPPDREDEVPSWRKELTQRLEALRNDRKTGESSSKTEKTPPPSVPRITKPGPAAKSPVFPPEHAGSIQVQKQLHKTHSAPAGPQASTPLQKTIASLGADVYDASNVPKSKSIRELIDKAVSKQAAPPEADTPIFRTEAPIEPDNKFILLSRTLSGLIDLIVIILCTGAFIIAADASSEIIVLDSISLIEYTILFLMIFFLYSIFFLAASGQTIGMMITDLRITGIEGSRPSIGQLFSRCFGYLLSIAVFGLGLLWGIFDPKNRCFHDRFSNTSIIRH